MWSILITLSIIIILASVIGCMWCLFKDYTKRFLLAIFFMYVGIIIAIFTLNDWRYKMDNKCEASDEKTEISKEPEYKDIIVDVVYTETMKRLIRNACYYDKENDMYTLYPVDHSGEMSKRDRNHIDAHCEYGFVEGFYLNEDKVKLRLWRDCTYDHIDPETEKLYVNYLISPNFYDDNTMDSIMDRSLNTIKLIKVQKDLVVQPDEEITYNSKVMGCTLATISNEDYKKYQLYKDYCLYDDNLECIGRCIDYDAKHDKFKFLVTKTISDFYMAGNSSKSLLNPDYIVGYYDICKDKYVFIMPLKLEKYGIYGFRIVNKLYITLPAYCDDPYSLNQYIDRIYEYEHNNHLLAHGIRPIGKYFPLDLCQPEKGQISNMYKIGSYLSAMVTLSNIDPVYFYLNRLDAEGKAVEIHVHKYEDDVEYPISIVNTCMRFDITTEDKLPWEFRKGEHPDDYARRSSQYLSWDNTFMMMAIIIAQRSKDPRTQVGAIIVDSEHRVLSCGYNGMPIGIDDHEIPWKADGEFLETKDPYVVHAEQNAILNYNGDRKNLNGTTMYVTLFPCCECAKSIIQSGIKHIIYYDDRDNDKTKAAKKMFDMVGIEYKEFHDKFTIHVQYK